jgi:hypothetical protein
MGDFDKDENTDIIHYGIVGENEQDKEFRGDLSHIWGRHSNKRLMVK